eukprot:Transcript_12802.p2 GENE.Transcript_12802~~Transcript_12802.p2  ORF type:complete len:748 (-),score=139.50 Transcript_12802:42-2285(-)
MPEAADTASTYSRSSPATARSPAYAPDPIGTRKKKTRSDAALKHTQQQMAELRAAGRPDPVVREEEPEPEPTTLQSEDTRPRGVHFDDVKRASQRYEIIQLKRTMAPESVKEHSIYISAFGRARAWREALETFEQMEAKGLQVDTGAFNTMISVLERAGRWEEALSIFERMKKSINRPNVVTYLGAIGAAGRGGLWEQALSFLELCKGIDGGICDRTYCATITALGRCGQWEEAIQVFEEMSEVGLQTTTVAFNSVIDACSKGGQWERATSLLDEMRRRGMQPDVRCYSTAISACAKAEQSKVAFELFEQMKAERVRPNEVTYNSVMSACAPGGQWREAWALMEEMEREHLRPDEYSFHAIISASKTAGEWERALQMLEEMRRRGLRPSVFTYSIAMAACDAAAQWERAMGVFKSMKKDQVRLSLVIYNSVISACAKCGQCDQALALLAEMQEDRPNQPAVEPNELSLSAAILACAKAGRCDRALQLFQEIERRGLTPTTFTYNAAILACAAGRRVDTAVSLFEAAIQSRPAPPATAKQAFNVSLDGMDEDSLYILFASVLDATCELDPDTARGLWLRGLALGVFGTIEPEPRRDLGHGFTLDLHYLSVGAAETAVRWWLTERVHERAKEPSLMPPRLIVVTGYGKSRNAHQTGEKVVDRVRTLLQTMGVTVLPDDNPGHFVLHGPSVVHLNAAAGGLMFNIMTTLPNRIVLACNIPHNTPSRATCNIPARNIPACKGNTVARDQLC